MTSAELKNIQTPLKDKYRTEPEAALITLTAQGTLADGISCKVATGKAITQAGLHPATGGTGLLACSGDMLLEALVACAGVTLSAVATAIEVEIKNAVLKAEGVLDFRGTLGVDKEAQVGFKAIKLQIDIETDAPADKLESLLKLTERYCVVYQTLKNGTAMSTKMDVV